jgi:16S rRNA (adenine1518-N6/adenine1519-N6)-dimethyltransferase
VTLSRTATSELLRRHGLAPRRALGQNFVVEPETVRRIARLANVTSDDHVVEVGAGLGALTLALADTGADITAVEVDSGLFPVLCDNVASRNNVRCVHADALRINWDELLADAPHWVLVANLPYNVGTPLVLDVLDSVPRITRMLVMVQKEVAERLCAKVGDDAYGAPSVKVAYWATARIVGDVPAAVFLPQPRVASALLEIRRRSEPLFTDVNPRALFAIVRTGFATRRKMLRSALKQVTTHDDFAAADIDPTARAEDLDVAQWVRLYRAVTSRQTSQQ